MYSGCGEIATRNFASALPAQREPAINTLLFRHNLGERPRLTAKKEEQETFGGGMDSLARSLARFYP